MSALLGPEEQAALRDEALKWARGAYDDARRRAAQASPGGHDPEAWRELAELGWLGLTVPEAQGGAGGGLGELMPVMEAVGAGLLAEPVGMVAGAVCDLLQRTAPAALQDELLPKLAAGETIITLAHFEADSGYDRDGVSTRVQTEGDDPILTGGKARVVAAEAADSFLVTAKDASGQLRLLLVPAKTEGLTVTGYRAVDGRRIGDLAFDKIALPAEARIGPAGIEEPLQASLDVASLLSAAEAIGAMDRLMEETADYLRTREQFGRPLSSFQALQHRMVDLFIMLEEARGSLAAAAAGDLPPAEQAAASAVACIKTAEAAHKIGRDAVQLHGGVGMTDALAIGHLFKRLLVASSQYGDAGWHRRRFQALQDGRLI